VGIGELAAVVGSVGAMLSMVVVLVRAARWSAESEANYRRVTDIMATLDANQKLWIIERTGAAIREHVETHHQQGSNTGGRQRLRESSDL